MLFRPGGKSRRRRARTSMRRAAHGGFTILEAIVALVVFASGTIALYGLYSTNVTALVKSAESMRQAPLVRRAVEQLSALHFTDESSGEFEIEGVRFTWTADRLEPYRQGQNAAGAVGSFQVGLYQLDFTATDQGRLLGRYSMRVMGHEVVRPPLP